MTRDFSSVSPSARSLLVMRAWADLPFARRAAEILFGEEALAAELARIRSLAGSELRRHHFEARYRSIDTLIAGAERVLELAAGLSFRGLDFAQRAVVAYVDTDLPEMAATKQQLVTALAASPLAGDLRVAALQALDADAFRATSDALPAGPITIVNEGLLMYLDDIEKQRLAANILDALSRRGGQWVTADIYVRVAGDPRIGRDDRLRNFLAAHRVEENKFASHDAAEAFFTGAGFSVAHRRTGDSTRESWVLVRR